MMSGSCNCTVVSSARDVIKDFHRDEGCKVDGDLFLYIASDRSSKHAKRG
jgi:hypothetical protein